MYYFVEKYVVNDSNPLAAVRSNAELCMKVGKREISEMWINLLELLAEDPSDVIGKHPASPENQKVSLFQNPNTEKADNIIKILDFYQKRPERFLVDLKNQRIKVESVNGKEPDIHLLDNYEKILI